MDAFESADGYVFLAELLLSDDVTDDIDSSDALRNLILLIGSLTTCGFIELKDGVVVNLAIFGALYLPCLALNHLFEAWIW